jgi:hypothetical protein
MPSVPSKLNHEFHMSMNDWQVTIYCPSVTSHTKAHATGNPQTLGFPCHFTTSLPPFRITPVFELHNGSADVLQLFYRHHGGAPLLFMLLTYSVVRPHLPSLFIYSAIIGLKQSALNSFSSLSSFPLVLLNHRQNHRRRPLTIR